MGRKGFTLVEMLAVVVIMGLILIVVIPQIQNQLANRKESVHEATLEMIYDAAEDLTSSDPSTFQKVYNDENDRSMYCITLQDLVDAGKLEAPIKNFKNGKELDLSYVVRATTNQYNEFEYYFTESTDCEASSSELVFYYDPILPTNGGTYPILYPGMIPVVYKNGYWVKASVYEAWYSYKEGENKWANVVTVNAKASTCKNDCIDTAQKHTRSYYEKAIAGTKISMDDITGMFVWIPKFEYKLTSPYGVGTGTSATSPGSIDVNFIAKNTTTATSGYTVHPAFTFGSKNIGGIWVSKFEASAVPTSSCNLSADAKTCNNTKTTVNITPNKNAWRYITIGNAYTVSSLMSTNTATFGFSSTSVDTHLMKNTEWGAVAYLSQSKYGKYGKDGKEVFPNKYFSTTTLTGCTSGASGTGLSLLTTCQDSKGNKLNYNYEASYSGSTSGTIYGIFDMSGGAWEYVMGNFNRNEASGGIVLNDIYEEETDENGEPVQVLKTQRIDDKYVNIYTAKTCANKECEGSAMLKTELSLSGSNWWLDEYDFDVTDLDSWLIRGGSWDLASEKLGIFALSKASGATNDKIGFRPVVTGLK